MATLDTETVIEAWELTLPEEEAGCSYCSGEAAWAIRIQPCGCNGGPLCTPCKANCQRHNAAALLRGRGAFCSDCALPSNGASYIPI